MAHGYNYFLWTLDISLDPISSCFLRAAPWKERGSDPRTDACYSFLPGCDGGQSEETCLVKILTRAQSRLLSEEWGRKLVSLGHPAPAYEVGDWEPASDLLMPQIFTQRLER